jgi:hypothetical protein
MFIVGMCLRSFVTIPVAYDSIIALLHFTAAMLFVFIVGMPGSLYSLPSIALEWGAYLFYTLQFSGVSFMKTNWVYGSPQSSAL